MTRTNPALYTEEITIKRFIPWSTYRFRCNICDRSKNMITERRKRYKPENNREIKSYVYGKHQRWDSSWELLPTANKQIKTVQESFYRKNWGETTFVTFCRWPLDTMVWSLHSLHVIGYSEYAKNFEWQHRTTPCTLYGEILTYSIVIRNSTS